MPRLHVQVFPGTRPWLPALQHLQVIDRLLTGPAQVQLHRRADLTRVWREEHGAELPGGPWSIRAWSTGDRAFIFVDPTETRQSTLWLFGHELAHVELNRAPLLKAAVAAPRDPDYLISDDAHEASPEEQLANRAGAMLLELLAGEREELDRRWWRQRVKARALRAHTRGGGVA